MQEHEPNLSAVEAVSGAALTPPQLRLWPGVVLAGLLVLVRYVALWLAPEAELAGYPLALLGVLGGVLGGLLLVVWWLFFSRAPWPERLAAPVLMVTLLLLAWLVVHASIRGGMMGMMLVLNALPLLGVALVVWAAATTRLSTGARRAALVATLLLVVAPWTLVRTAGVTSTGSEFHWRWTPTPEERLLTQVQDEPLPGLAATPAEVPSVAPSPATSGSPAITPTATPTATPSTTSEAAPAVGQPAAELRADWPGFRGARRDGVVRGLQVNPDWTTAPPVEVWRRPIGPGWSSFAVRGELLYTQEQRGEEELVGCYKVATGEPVWRHRDAVRFWESNGGAGPRATPTLSGNRVYAFGATGLLNALDARTGKVVWTRNVANDTGRKVPGWGFASSPLVVDDIVVVAAAGTLAAYEVATGKPRWQGPAYDGSYSSPQRVTLKGVSQILLLGGPGALSVAPADGTVLWEHKWESGTIVQPALLPDGDMLISAIAGAGGIGTRRLRVAPGPTGWSVEERWTSNGLKPYFNDFVIHEGHAYGFDGSILACINLADGKRKWKGGRYGNGQLVLLADQDLLLVLTEEGELALVNATPEQFTERARLRALEGKTWNHPALAGDLLLTRNGEQMAAFRLPVVGR